MKFEFIENEGKNITTEQMDYLSDLLKISDEIKKGLGLRFAPMQIVGSTVRFNGIAANIRLNDTELIVKPKVTNAEGKSVDELMRTLYLRILKTCKANLNSVIYFTSMSTENISDDTFVDCIAQYYMDRLYFAMQKLPIVVYYQREEKRSSIKGKILIQKELQNPIRDGKTWCRYKMLSKDNQYNALLKWCCDYFADNVSSKSLRYKLRQISNALEGNFSELTMNSVRTMRLPRNFDAYREPFNIAKEIFLYNSQTTKLSSDSKNICGYVINMETAFENIVCYYADRFTLKKQLLHVPQADTVLASSDKGRSDMDFHIRPDDLIIKGNEKLVMDAKYKYVSGSDKPTRDDFYQMVSSCIAHGTDEAVLIYPSTEVDDAYSESWTLINPINGVNFKVYANKIDIFSDDQTIIGQISSAVYRSRFAEVACGKI